MSIVITFCVTYYISLVDSCKSDATYGTYRSDNRLNQKKVFLQQYSYYGDDFGLMGSMIDLIVESNYDRFI